MTYLLLIVVFVIINLSESLCAFGSWKLNTAAFLPQNRRTTIYNNNSIDTKRNLSNSSSSPKNDDTTTTTTPTSKPKKSTPPGRKKKKIVINQNLAGVGNVSSDGLLTEQKKEQREAQKAREGVKSNLGVTKKTKMKDSNKAAIQNNNQTKKKLSKKAQKIADQRTANGTIDGNLQAGLALPEDQHIQIQEMKRGNKQITIVR